MWKPISNSENINFFLKYIEANKVYYFYLTNFIKIWETQLNEENLLSIIKKNNPLMEANGSSMIDCSINLLFKKLSSDGSQSIFKFKQDQEIELCFHISDDNFNFKLPLEFTISNSETFCEHVTLPAMMRLRELYNCEEQLMNLLLKKDLEILEYQNEGAVLPDHIKQTQPFQLQNHKEIHKTFMQFLGENNVSDVSKHLCESFGIPSKSIDEGPAAKKAKITPTKDSKKEKSQEIKEVTKQELKISNMIPTNASLKIENGVSKIKKNNKKKLGL